MTDAVLGAVSESAAPSTVPELTRRLGVHANTVRAHLAGLLEDGLVARESVPAKGRGRPSHVYWPSAMGWTVLRGGSVVEEYRGLSAAFAEHLAAHSTDPTGEARAVGRAWGRQLAARGASTSSTGRSSTTAQEEVVGLLEDLRFSPSSDAEGIALRTCPLLDVAQRLPEVVCQVHRGLVEGVLERHGTPDVEVDLIPFAEPGACRLRLRSS